MRAKRKDLRKHQTPTAKRVQIMRSVLKYAREELRHYLKSKPRISVYCDWNKEILKEHLSAMFGFTAADLKQAEQARKALMKIATRNKTHRVVTMCYPG